MCELVRIFQPIMKSGQKLDPLPVRELLKSQRTFHQKYWDVEGEYQLATPLKRNTNLPKAAFPPRVSAAKFTRLTDKDLQVQEQYARESLCVWSAIRWGHSTMQRLLTDKSLSAENLKE